MNKKDYTYIEIVEDIKNVAENAGMEPYLLTKTIYKKFGGIVPEWQLRKFGGFTNIINSEFKFQENLDFSAIRGSRLRTNYVNKLQKEIGDWAYYEKRLGEAFIEALKKEPIQITEKKQIKYKSKKKNERINQALISDTHFGITIDPLEVEGNIYNWEIAARRLGLFISSIADFKQDHRSECDALVLNMGGDLTQGIIHPEDVNIDLLAWQILGATKYLVSSIDYLLEFYPKIIIPVTTDNHMRIITHIKGRERARAQKFDSYNTIMFNGVQYAFRNEPRVEFIMPRTPYTLYKIFGKTHCLTHGDTYFSTGYPAKGVNIQKLTSQIDHLNAASPMSEQIQVLMAGHVHNGLYMEMPNGVHLVINPSMSGVDPYAQSVGITRSNPAQWMWESTRDHVIGDMRLVKVQKADLDSVYESIIPPFDYSIAIRETNF